MAKYHKGIFTPKNPQKNKTVGRCSYDSSWELTILTVFDQNPNVIEWAREPIGIEYRSPVDGLVHKYYPDFIVAFVDTKGRKHVELIEIKPNSQTLAEAARSKKDKAAQLVNEAKWAAARQFCKAKGMYFRIMTEHDLYYTGKNRTR